MKNHRVVKMLLVAALVPSSALLRCGANPPVSGGTETGDSKIASMLYNPDGSPAVSAKVGFYRHGDDPRNNHAVDSTYTTVITSRISTPEPITSLLLLTPLPRSRTLLS